MEGLRRFITVDSREAVKIGDWVKTVESLSVVEPKCTSDFPEAVVREGADELTPRDTVNVGNSRWEPPLVDGDWHANGQAIYKGVVGAEWENFYHKVAALRTLRGILDVFCN